MNPLDLLAVFAGGGLGSALRYAITLTPLKEVGGVGFPLGTLITNVAGSFVIGVIAGLATTSAAASPRMALFARVGICGGFTTFSTFALESTGLLQRGGYLAGLGYMTLSFVLGVAAVAAGQAAVGLAVRS